jgi:signal transduction histidine kinase
LRLSFQKRISLLFALSSLGSALGAVLGLVAVLSYQRYQEEREELREIAVKYRDILKADPVLGEESRRRLPEIINAEPEHEPLSLALLSKEGRVLQTWPADSRDCRRVLERFDHQPGFGFYLRHHDDWLFHEFIRGDNYDILIVDKHDTHFLSSAGLTLLFLLPFLIVACYLLGSFHARRVVEPLQAIGAVARRQAEGELDARIAQPGGGDEIQRLCDDLNHSFAELQKTQQTVRRFSADAAHELRTPIAAIMGNIEVTLSRQRSGDDYQAALGETLEELQQLSRILDSLLLMTRPRSVYLDSFLKVDPCRIIAKVADDLDFLIVDKNLKLLSECRGERQISCLPTLFERLVANLLHNAIKFSPPGGEIRLGWDSSGSRGRLEIEDRGPGLPKESHQRIFEPFYQNDASRGQSGVGLGLALVKFIAELHQARIEVSQASPQGLKISVEFPLPPA